MSLSYWAKEHIWAARILLAVSQTILSVSAIYIAVLLDKQNVHLHYSVPLVAMVLLVACVISYRFKKHGKTSLAVYYYKRKCCELVFLLSSLICVCFIYNKDSRVMYFNNYQALQGSFLEKEKAEETPVQTGRQERKNLRKRFKVLLKEVRKSKLTTTAKIALITLIVLGGAFLFTVVVSLSCSLWCSGSATLGNVVFFGGVPVIYFLMVFGIIKVMRANKEKGEERFEVPEFN